MGTDGPAHGGTKAVGTLRPPEIRSLGHLIANRLIAGWAAQERHLESDGALLSELVALSSSAGWRNPFADLLSAAAARDLVSMVIPAHNAAAYLAETLDSLLAQTHPQLQIVVVYVVSVSGTGAKLRFGVS